MSQTTRGEAGEWIKQILLAVLIALVVRAFVVEIFLVEGHSMKPTLQDGERLLVNKFIFRFRSPMQGDIIVFRYPRDPERDFIKRVVAVGGDEIEIRDGQVLVNGVGLKERYILGSNDRPFPRTIVPAGHTFVMGDNRGASLDSRSREVGFISIQDMKGKAMVVLWPFAHWRVLGRGDLAGEAR